MSMMASIQRAGRKDSEGVRKDTRRNAEQDSEMLASVCFVCADSLWLQWK